MLSHEMFTWEPFSFAAVSSHGKFMFVKLSMSAWESSVICLLAFWNNSRHFSTMVFVKVGYRLSWMKSLFFMISEFSLNNAMGLRFPRMRAGFLSQEAAAKALQSGTQQSAQLSRIPLSSLLEFLAMMLAACTPHGVGLWRPWGMSPSCCAKHWGAWSWNQHTSSSHLRCQHSGVSSPPDRLGPERAHPQHQGLWTPSLSVPTFGESLSWLVFSMTGASRPSILPPIVELSRQCLLAFLLPRSLGAHLRSRWRMLSRFGPAERAARSCESQAGQSSAVVASTCRPPSFSNSPGPNRHLLLWDHWAPSHARALCWHLRRTLKVLQKSFLAIHSFQQNPVPCLKLGMAGRHLLAPLPKTCHFSHSVHHSPVPTPKSWWSQLLFYFSLLQPQECQPGRCLELAGDESQQQGTCPWLAHPS